ncbi:hypothetical protein NLU13_7795 [Sarocladium strictum]|uniref:Uncharacterized protein n=1 Tax=Sarocladium strictum TaxID=5046 RepID=A0AA39GE60_SARSR|nr:hypothetical protein NLU13_7795 [Sarocladium strictum]
MSFPEASVSSQGEDRSHAASEAAPSPSTSSRAMHTAVIRPPPSTSTFDLSDLMDFYDTYFNARTDLGTLPSASASASAAVPDDDSTDSESSRGLSRTSSGLSDAVSGTTRLTQPDDEDDQSVVSSIVFSDDEGQTWSPTPESASGGDEEGSQNGSDNDAVEEEQNDNGSDSGEEVTRNDESEALVKITIPKSPYYPIWRALNPHTPITLDQLPWETISIEEKEVRQEAVDRQRRKAYAELLKSSRPLRRPQRPQRSAPGADLIPPSSWDYLSFPALLPDLGESHAASLQPSQQVGRAASPTPRNPAEPSLGGPSSPQLQDDLSRAMDVHGDPYATDQNYTLSPEGDQVPAEGNFEHYTSQPEHDVPSSMSTVSEDGSWCEITHTNDCPGCEDSEPWNFPAQPQIDPSAAAAPSEEVLYSLPDVTYANASPEYWDFIPWSVEAPLSPVSVGVGETWSISVQDDHPLNPAAPSFTPSDTSRAQREWLIPIDDDMTSQELESAWRMQESLLDLVDGRTQ